MHKGNIVKAIERHEHEEWAKDRRRIASLSDVDDNLPQWFKDRIVISAKKRSGSHRVEKKRSVSPSRALVSRLSESEKLQAVDRPISKSSENEEKSSTPVVNEAELWIQRMEARIKEVAKINDSRMKHRQREGSFSDKGDNTQWTLRSKPRKLEAAHLRAKSRAKNQQSSPQLAKSGSPVLRSNLGMTLGISSEETNQENEDAAQIRAVNRRESIVKSPLLPGDQIQNQIQSQIQSQTQKQTKAISTKANITQEKKPKQAQAITQNSPIDPRMVFQRAINDGILPIELINPFEAARANSASSMKRRIAEGELPVTINTALHAQNPTDSTSPRNRSKKPALSKDPGNEKDKEELPPAVASKTVVYLLMETDTDRMLRGRRSTGQQVKRAKARNRKVEQVKAKKNPIQNPQSEVGAKAEAKAKAKAKPKESSNESTFLTEVSQDIATDEDSPSMLPIISENSTGINILPQHRMARFDRQKNQALTRHTSNFSWSNLSDIVQVEMRTHRHTVSQHSRRRRRLTQLFGADLTAMNQVHDEDQNIQTDDFEVNVTLILPNHAGQTCRFRMSEAISAEIMTRMEVHNMLSLRREFRRYEGELTLKRFVRAMLKYLPEPPTIEDKIRLVSKIVELFDQIDINGDGTLEWYHTWGFFPT